MSEKKRGPALIAFIPIGFALIVIAITTENYGFLGAGVLFVGIGAVSVARSRKNEKENEPGDEQQGD